MSLKYLESETAYSRDVSLNHVWKALSCHNAAECLRDMAQDEADQKRSALLAIAAKFLEEKVSEELRLAYEKLKEVFTENAN